LSRNAGKMTVNPPILPANFVSLAVDSLLSILLTPTTNHAEFLFTLPILSRNLSRLSVFPPSSCCREILAKVSNILIFPPYLCCRETFLVAKRSSQFQVSKSNSTFHLT
jgi:hypothetical protein